MRYPALVLAAASLLAACPSLARADDWQGVLRCGPIPGLTTRGLKEPFTLTVLGNHAQYTRQLHQAEGSGTQPYAEQGAGTIGPDGTLTLQGGAIGRGFQYTATYSGVLAPGVAAARLRGVQLWTTRRVRQVQRECSMRLSR